MKASENNKAEDELKKVRAEDIIDTHHVSVLEGIEIIVKNPGIPYYNPVLIEAQNKNIPIITEIEIAGKLAEEQTVSITGSNGKTTTTTLTTEMLKMSN